MFEIGTLKSDQLRSHAPMDWKLEAIVIPVTDVDRAKQFYVDKLGFNLDVDHLSFGDPDGNGWLVQEVKHHHADR
jgi:catechol 2,3-dioxygenase-like lactoylglutathione lyase family enzyme